MKKLMIAAAIVCAAAFTQAANYTWDAADSYIYSTDDAGGTYPAVAQGTLAYFAFVDAYTQADLVNDFANGSVNYGKFATGATSAMNSTGGVALSAEFVANYNADQSAYFVVFEDGNMFVSDIATAVYKAIGTSSVSFANQMDTSDWEAFFGDAADGYTQAGWYHTSAAPEPSGVPEPTSGLLLLIGMAGLALKRRRA